MGLEYDRMAAKGGRFRFRLGQAAAKVAPEAGGSPAGLLGGLQLQGPVSCLKTGGHGMKWLYK